MIIVNMLSTITVSIPTLIISMFTFMGGTELSTTKIVLTSFGLFQASTSLAISIISMVVPGWSRFCVDTVIQSERLEQRKISEREVREKLLKYYLRVKNYLLEFCGTLGNDSQTGRTKYAAVHATYMKMMATYNSNDPIPAEESILQIMESLLQLDNPDIRTIGDDEVEGAKQEADAYLRIYANAVIDQKIVLGHSLDQTEKDALAVVNESRRREMAAAFSTRV